MILLSMFYTNGLHQIQKVSRYYNTYQNGNGLKGYFFLPYIRIGNEGCHMLGKDVLLMVRRHTAGEHEEYDEFQTHSKSVTGNLLVQGSNILLITDEKIR